MMQFSLDMIDIGIPYPGASPEEVGEGVCIKVEEQLKSLEDVKTMYSTSFEGYGSNDIHNNCADKHESISFVKRSIKSNTT